MDQYQMDPKDAVIIGDVAKQYKISKRTLRLYHDMGLLTPYYVDQQTGYRYYLPSQFPRLEMILQMKDAGLPLKRIKEMLDMQSTALFEVVLGEQIDKLNEQIAECRLHKANLLKQMESCQHMRNPPILDTVFVEYIPRRPALIYQIEPYDFQKVYPDGSPWQKALDTVKASFVRDDVPLALFQQVGGIISGADLKNHIFTCCGAFVPLHEDSAGRRTRFIDSGTYVCLYHRYQAMDNIAELKSIRVLLDYIEAHDYEIVGDYYAEVIAETSIFDDSPSKDILVKQQIPIRIF